MEVVTAGAQDELMQSLDYKLKTSNTSYVTARHDVQYFPSSLSSFSPTTSRVCRIPLTSGTSFIDPESIKIAFRVRNTDGTNPLAPATPNPACFVQRVQVFANGQRCDDINYYGRTVAAHDLLKGREYNRNKAMEGFDEVNDPRIARAMHQGGYADALLRPTMVGILRCAKMLPPQLNLVIEIEFADATTALWSENAGAHPSGATLSTVRSRTSGFWPPGRLVESFNRVLLSGRSLVFSYPTVHTQQSSVLNGPHWRGQAGGQPSGVSDAAGQPAVPSQPHEGSLRALPLPLLAGTYDDTVRNIDIGRVGYLRHSFIAGFPTERVPKMPLSGVSTRSGDLAGFTFKGLDGTMTDLFIHLVAYQLVTLSGTGVSVLD